MTSGRGGEPESGTPPTRCFASRGSGGWCPGAWGRGCLCWLPVIRRGRDRRRSCRRRSGWDRRGHRCTAAPLRESGSSRLPCPPVDSHPDTDSDRCSAAEWNLALLRQGNRVINGLAAVRDLVQEHSQGSGKNVDDRRRNKKWWAGQSARPPRLCQRARRAHASLGDTVTTVSVIPTGPGAAGVISPNFFLFVTTMGVIVS